MKQLELSNLEIADLCREMALLLHAGIGLGDGLALLAEQETNLRFREILTQMAEDVDLGAFLAQAFEKSGCFPAFLTGLVHVGETTGRLEEALNALAVYHENRERMRRQVVSALTYPMILLAVMLGVILVLLSKVLPVFNEIYQSLGGRLTGVAGGLLMLGEILNRALPFLGLVLAVGLVLFACIKANSRLRSKVMALWLHRWGDRGIARKWNNARFAQAMMMGFGSGISLEESVELAAGLLQDVPGAVARCAECAQLLREGEDLAVSLTKTELLPHSAGRLLTLGIRSGNGDAALEDISRRMTEDAQQALEDLVSKVEPALVLVTSALVGVILLSVMLPLMNIMTAIG